MDKSVIVIVDYGMGNIRSIVKKINNAGYDAIVSKDHETLLKAKKLILPGVGHFGAGMNMLRERNLIEVLNYKVIQNKTPILGICLGMQLFSIHSDEGDCTGLGWIDAETVKFKLDDVRFKVPHIGWNSIKTKRKSPLFADIPENGFFYFVHSYHIVSNSVVDVISTSIYGYEFISSIQKENIFGTQFHPEKSHKIGEKMLHNFLNL
jgi:imidazole glycerol-phosphate synthase subunit HisH